MSFLRLSTVFLALFSAAVATSAQAAPIQIGVFNGGAFGVNGAGIANTLATPDMQPFVFGGLVSAGDNVTITATGNMFLSGSSLPAGPDGVVLNAGLHTTVIGNTFGALIGTIVTTATANAPGFQAYDALDVAVGIEQANVFLIGSSFSFVAGQSGSLYLGISDSAWSDNTGPGYEADVSITPAVPVPAPGPISILSLGLIALGLRRRAV